MIDIKGIKKSFGSLEVLKGIDLHINKGEVVSIVGPSGAGKTTLLQIQVLSTLMASTPLSCRANCFPTSATATLALYSSSISYCQSLQLSRTS